MSFQTVKIGMSHKDAIKAYSKDCLIFKKNQGLNTQFSKTTWTIRVVYSLVQKTYDVKITWTHMASSNRETRWNLLQWLDGDNLGTLRFRLSQFNLHDFRSQIGNQNGHVQSKVQIWSLWLAKNFHFGTKSFRLAPLVRKNDFYCGFGP